MSPSISQQTVPVFARGLTALAAVLDKAEAFARAKKIDDSVLLGARLAADMHPLSRQVQTATDLAKIAVSRLAGAEWPKYDDTEKTFSELKARIEKTLAYVHTVSAATLDAAADKDVTFPMGPGMKATLTGADYVNHFSLPNFYFHITTAYAILRHTGVELGKRDFIGAVPGLVPVAA